MELEEYFEIITETDEISTPFSFSSRWKGIITIEFYAFKPSRN